MKPMARGPPKRDQIMFESFGFETLTPHTASIGLALLLGGLFGSVAQISRFCFRRAVIGDRSAAGTWAAALAMATLLTQIAVARGWISFAEHRLHSPDLPLLALLIGGALFGAGMVLTRGCASRLTVLAASGNLRAALVILLFAVAAHASMKGILAPLTTAIRSITVPMPAPTLPAGVALPLAAVLAALAWRNATPRLIALGAAIGALAASGWIMTGFVLVDDFDPIPQASLAFTAPMADGLFYTIAATAVPMGFGAALVLGVLLGAFASARARGDFAWQSFSSPRQTGRYALGALFMGFGGTLAGGCTIGAGLSGGATLSIAAFIALMAMAMGARVALVFLSEDGPLSGAQPTTPPQLPAE